MGMTKTMLQEDINKLETVQRSRAEIVEMFYQRLYNIINHVKYDINSLRENATLKLDDMKDFYMITDMYAIQMEEVVDKIKSDVCLHETIRTATGAKICDTCQEKIA